MPARLAASRCPAATPSHASAMLPGHSVNALFLSFRHHMTWHVLLLLLLLLLCRPLYPAKPTCVASASTQPTPPLWGLVPTQQPPAAVAPLAAVTGCHQPWLAAAEAGRVHVQHTATIQTTPRGGRSFCRRQSALVTRQTCRLCCCSSESSTYPCRCEPAVVILFCSLLHACESRVMRIRSYGGCRCFCQTN